MSLESGFWEYLLFIVGVVGVVVGIVSKNYWLVILGVFAMTASVVSCSGVLG